MAKASFLNGGSAGEVKIVGKARVRKVGFAEAIAALEYEGIFQPACAVNAGKEPTENIIAFYVGGMQAEFACPCLDFVLNRE